MDEMSYARSFLTDRKYDWTEEMAGRNPWSGTRMPLSALTRRLRVRYNWRVVTPDKYLTASVRALHLEAHYDLHPAGKEVLRVQQREFGLERSRIGTLSTWTLRGNERLRQIARLKHWQRLDEQGKLPYFELRRRFVDWFVSERLPEWKRVFEFLIDAIQDNIDQGSERVFDVFQQYRNAQDKHKSSYMRGVAWKQVKEKDALAGAHAVSQTLSSILKEGLWASKAPNPKCFLAALRNRPLDKVYGGAGVWRPMMMSTNYTVGDMYRSRGALGLIPLSHVWAYSYNVKEEVINSFLDRLLQGLPVYTPMLNTSFYKDFVFLTRNGWYMFGDNIAKVENGDELVYDVSMSEILQGHLRTGERGENFVWFPWLTNGVRQAPSGDPFTTLWNLEGNVGLLHIRDEDPGLFLDEGLGLTDVLEETKAFLGMGRSRDGRVMNMGLKLTVDSADKRIPVHLRPTGGLLHWGPAKVDLMRALQTVVAYGLHTDVDLRWWYDRVTIEETPLELEYMSADERIENGFTQTPSLVDELVDIIGERKLIEWWPHLEIDLMKRRTDNNDGNNTEERLEIDS